ncbi:unnamed protein product, partial [Mesorhabditis spiculigera]
MRHGENGTPFLGLLIDMRRRMAENRRQLIKPEHWERSRVQLHVDELSIEWHLFSEHLIHHPLFQRIRDLDWLSYEGGPPSPEPSRAYTDFFYLHYVFELVLATVRGGGVQMDACITTTGLKIDADMESLTIFYSASPLADPVCMARLAQPFFEHLIRTCAKALQALQLDETETAYVHYIITTSWLTFQQNDSATCRGILCQELHRHYSALKLAHGDAHEPNNNSTMTTSSLKR